MLSSSREQANFQGLEASRPRPRTSKSVLEDSTSVEYLETAESRRMKSTPIESNSIGLIFDTPIDVAFSPRLNSTKLIHYILFKLNYQQFKWCGCINAANRRYKQNAKAQFLVTDSVWLWLCNAACTLALSKILIMQSRESSWFNVGNQSVRTVAEIHGPRLLKTSEL